MIAACKAHLIERIKAAGIQTVLDRGEDLARHHGPTFAFVALVDDQLQRDGSRVARVPTGYRRRLYKRSSILRMSVTAPSSEEAASWMAAIVVSLGARIDDGNGNAVLLRPSTSATEDDRSLLAAKSTASVDVQCVGGVYRDEIVGVFLLPDTDVKLEPRVVGQRRGCHGHQNPDV